MLLKSLPSLSHTWVTFNIASVTLQFFRAQINHQTSQNYGYHTAVSPAKSNCPSQPNHRRQELLIRPFSLLQPWPSVIACLFSQVHPLHSSPFLMLGSSLSFMLIGKFPQRNFSPPSLPSNQTVLYPIPSSNQLPPHKHRTGKSKTVCSSA